MQRIGRYEILDKIGEGGMGSVFVAHDTRLDRRVAVKVLLRADADDDQLARFEREGKAIAALNHPNILAIYDFDLDADRPFIVMELLDGRTLRKVIDEGPVPVHKAIRYGLEIAQGLAAAHDKGICHRDLKPQNVLVTEDDRIKIVDFGLAAVRRATIDVDEAATAAATAVGTVLGTVGYMAPEQVRGEPADYRADIFAFGCVLFEILTGTRAFREPSAIETMHAILKTSPPFEQLERLQIPAGLIPLVRRCLEKRAADRFQSARDLAFLLQTLENAPVSSSSTSPAPVAVEPVSEPRTIAVLPFENLSRDPEMEYFSDGVTEDIMNALARLPELRVTGRTSSFTFRGQSVDLAVVKERLDVATVLEGSVRRSGNRLRVTTRLVAIETGYQMWAERYDRELDDVFAIQDDIATNIAHHLRLTLAADRGPTPDKASTHRMEAYDLYLRGRYQVEQRGIGIANGLRLFQKALSIDPNFALAHAALAETLVLLRVYGVGDPEAQRRHAPEAAQRALALDATLAEAHNAAAMVRMFIEWDWVDAETEFDRALEINPNYISARYWKGCWLLGNVKGEFDAGIAEIRQAVALDPMGIPTFALGLALVAAGRPEEARDVATDGLARDPESPLLHRIVAGAALAMGDYAAAVRSLETLVAVTMREAGVLAELGVALAAGGRNEEALQIRNELEARAKTSPVPPTSLAILADALGEREAAVANLRRAVEIRDPLFLLGARWPSVAWLRRDDRVRKLYELAGISLPVS